MHVQKFLLYFGPDSDNHSTRTTMKKTLLALSILLLSVGGAKAQNISDELVNVYRWWNTVDRQFVTVAEGEFQEGQMINWGWKDKSLMFVAYRNPGPDRVAVYSWQNQVTKDQASMAEDEFNDDQMIKMGYTNKKLQFYAGTRRGPNTVAIYRWRINKSYDWVNVPEYDNTDVYNKKGYKRKTFQFFGIVRSTDVKIYDQM